MEVFGYIVIENAIAPELVERLRALLYDFERRVLRGEPLPAGLRSSEQKHDYFRIDNLPHVDRSFYAYVSDPRLVAFAGEVIGHRPRLLQSDAHIRRSGSSTYRHYFHRDNRQDLQFTVNGMYHHPFIKTLTILSDVGPDDGGTCVIPGSHKISPDLDSEDVIAAAQADPRLIHQMVAPAGSTLLFYESLLHTSGINYSGKDRPLIIAGYIPASDPIPQECMAPPEFLASLPEAERRLLVGEPPGTDTSIASRSIFPKRRPVLPIPPPAQPPAEPWIDFQGIRITGAMFGAEGRFVDVMHLVRRIAAGERLLISFLTAGDPAPLVFKTTTITWTGLDGETHARDFVEGHIIHLDELLQQGAPLATAR